MAPNMSDATDSLPLESAPTFRKADQTVYIFNMSEDVWPFIDAMSDPDKRAFEIKENARLADRELFSLADEPDAIYICPQEIDPRFLSYFKEVMNVRNITVLVPEHHSGQISRDCLADKRIFETLTTVGKRAKRLSVFAYSTTFQFLELIEALRAEGLNVFTPESPAEEQAWTVNFYGSKSGIRQLAQKSSAQEPDLLMPDGLVCSGRIDAARIAANKYLKEKGVVLKTNKGHSGAGVLIFREGDLPTTYKACEQAVLKKLKEDEYWEMFPIVIESLINVNPAVGGGFPNVEFRIKRNGEIEFLYCCGLRVTEGGVFLGVEINEDVLNDRIQARLVDTGFFVGEQYAAAGYRGFFDVDFVAAKNGEMYVTESNVRRTGGTFGYAAAKAVMGKDFMLDSYTLVVTGFNLQMDKKVTFSEVLVAITPVLFDKKTKQGVVIASANILEQNQLGYIVFSPTKKRSLEIEAELHRLLKKL